MPQFVTNINYLLTQLIDEADREIVLVSPFVRLNPELRNQLKIKSMMPTLKITLMFGKNQDNYFKSITPKDYLFFKEFPNIEIRYDNRLNSCFYANEKSSIVTTMNLYDYPEKNNIEAGIFISSNFLNNLIGDTFDSQVFEHFQKAIADSTILYKTVPKFSTNIFGAGKKYKGSEVEIDLVKNIPASNNLLHRKDD